MTSSISSSSTGTFSAPQLPHPHEREHILTPPPVSLATSLLLGTSVVRPPSSTQLSSFQQRQEDAKGMSFSSMKGRRLFVCSAISRTEGWAPATAKKITGKRLFNAVKTSIQSEDNQTQERPQKRQRLDSESLSNNTPSSSEEPATESFKTLSLEDQPQAVSTASSSASSSASSNSAA